MKRIWILLFVLTALTTAAQADDQTLSLSPAVVMLRGEHGQSTTQTLTLSNATEIPFTFELVAEDVVIRDGKRVFVPAGEISGSIAATAVFSQPRVTIAAGENASVSVTLTLPHETAARGVVVLFRGVNRIMTSSTPITASLGTLMTFNVSERVELSAQPVVVRPQTATANLGVSQRCANSGTEPLVAKAVMAIVDADGKLLGTTNLDAQRLLPGETAEFRGEYGGELAAGKYRILLTYDFEGKSLTHTAELQIQ